MNRRSRNKQWLKGRTSRHGSECIEISLRPRALTFHDPNFWDVCYVTSPTWERHTASSPSVRQRQHIAAKLDLATKRRIGLVPVSMTAIKTCAQNHTIYTKYFIPIRDAVFARLRAGELPELWYYGKRTMGDVQLITIRRNTVVLRATDSAVGTHDYIMRVTDNSRLETTTESPHYVTGCLPEITQN